MYFNAGDHEFFYATYAVFSFRYNMKQHIKTHRDRNMTPEEEAAYLPKGGRSCRSPEAATDGSAAAAVAVAADQRSAEVPDVGPPQKNSPRLL